MAKMNDKITVKQALIGLASSIIVMLLGNMLIFGHEEERDWKIKIDKKADIDYVDKQDSQLRKEIYDSQTLILKSITEFRAETQTNFSEVRKQLYKK